MLFNAKQSNQTKLQQLNMKSKSNGLNEISLQQQQQHHSDATTPQQHRRRLFSPKNLRSPFGQWRSAAKNSNYSENNSTLSGRFNISFFSVVLFLLPMLYTFMILRKYLKKNKIDPIEIVVLFLLIVKKSH